MSITLKDFSLDNIEEVDVIVSDYKFEQLKYLLKKSNIKFGFPEKLRPNHNEMTLPRTLQKIFFKKLY